MNISFKIHNLFEIKDLNLEKIHQEIFKHEKMYTIEEISWRFFPDWIVAYNENEIVGMACIGDKFFLYNFGILEKYRNRGIATKMLNFILENYKTIQGQVYKNNPKAIYLYKKFNTEFIENKIDNTETFTFIMNK